MSRALSMHACKVKISFISHQNRACDAETGDERKSRGKGKARVLIRDYHIWQYWREIFLKITQLEFWHSIIVTKLFILTWIAHEFI